METSRRCNRVADEAGSSTCNDGSSGAPSPVKPSPALAPAIVPAAAPADGKSPIDPQAEMLRLAMLGKHLGAIVHELQQPLQAAKAFAQAASRTLHYDRPDASRIAIEHLEKVAAAIDRGGRMVGRLRDLARQRPLQGEPLCLGQVAAATLAALEPELRGADVRVEAQIAEDLPTVRGDPLLLELACANLVRNACEAMVANACSERRLTISACESGDLVRLAVSDRGPGISPEQRSHLFQAFYTTKPDGLGLGLVLCRSIAEAHRGQLTLLDSGFHPGATFELSLPRAT